MPKETITVQDSTTGEMIHLDVQNRATTEQIGQTLLQFLDLPPAVSNLSIETQGCTTIIAIRQFASAECGKEPHTVSIYKIVR